MNRPDVERIGALLREAATADPHSHRGACVVRELIAQLGAALGLPADATPAPTLDAGTFYFTADLVHRWRHSMACEDSKHPNRCVCGLSALLGIVEPMQRRVFALRAEAPQ